ncbi:cellulose biosynthesis cyclic di-GMP-binding regulatory protein BcsB [Leptolyngbya sp. FACHB-261]|uniref:cellulose biosynthesis cyclic di-GMP-binding regulatory protein BcsB n=1 Tax=Leptolyngbya sp. FACHB-261 TaxID=2692806 RepID=UPI001688F249|nr:cellulose biosynthesis cyclic di-GMP-binding regulatory protein BcsB [Leptolyngbya sp. FACHB-261]MBD2101701.1 cellulose biosynthesis cyclic di-GMP-binding regulatory protein BcsB [Leptolyngbya sp. FACHB-261]
MFHRLHRRLFRWLSGWLLLHRRGSYLAGCLLLCLPLCLLVTGLTAVRVTAQSFDQSLERQENQVIREFALPRAPRRAPVVRQRPPAPAPAPRLAPAPRPAAPRPAAPRATAPAEPESTAQAERPVSKPAPAQPAAQPSLRHELLFNRSPVVGNRLRLQGQLAESRLAFSRPASWEVQSVQAIIRFRHSPNLVAPQSNLTVRVNETSLGSVPLSQRDLNIGEMRVPVPVNLLQDYNEVAVVAQQRTAGDCSDLNDPALWTEVLPDSRLVFQFRPKPMALDFSQYPRPFFDPLSLETTRISYLLPSQVDPDWLTAAARLSAHFGRLAQFRRLDQGLITSLSAQERLRDWGSIAIIGTPASQPSLNSLDLPFAIRGGQLVDGAGRVLPPDVGVLMAVTGGPEQALPVLVASGNGAEGVAKAVQALVQAPDRAIAVGQAVLVDQLEAVPSPSGQTWPGYLPTGERFGLSDLGVTQDVTLRGMSAPALNLDFRALPSEAFDSRRNTMTLSYSHSTQVDPRNSSVEVLLDGVTLASAPLEVNRAERRTLNVPLPGNSIKPDSQLQVAFRLSPQNRNACGASADQQLWGTIHAGDTNFQLNRYESFELPDLKLLRYGFPFAAPQDLSSTALVLPDNPSPIEIGLMLSSAERLGRLSQADSVQLLAVTLSKLNRQAQLDHHLIALGRRERFPLPEVLEAKAEGLRLDSVLGRLRGQTRLQALPDSQGLITETLSPWNNERAVLALTAQTDDGLRQIQDLLRQDQRFFQVQGDTVLLNADASLKVLTRLPPRRIEKLNGIQRWTHFLGQNWYLVPFITVLSALLLFGLAQLYIQRTAQRRESV